ncbi:MAG: hypothetical protein AVDCRST_MAG80-1356, partial [uncultured Rubrobacteraceae bacterium]
AHRSAWKTHSANFDCRGWRVLGLQGLRGRGAGPAGPGEGHGTYLRGPQRAQRDGKPAAQRAGEL